MAGTQGMARRRSKCAEEVRARKRLIGRCLLELTRCSVAVRCFGGLLGEPDIAHAGTQNHFGGIMGIPGQGHEGGARRDSGCPVLSCRCLPGLAG